VVADPVRCELVAATAYPVAFFMRTQRARARLHSDGTAVVATAAQEFGTGMTTC
jgi:xanthine dehydrogenase YagR molybdenum-binding subunit